MQFESWEDIKDWLEDTIAEGTDISERVDRALYPFKFDYTLEEEMFRGNGDRYAIYHVDEGTPGKQHLFMNMAMVKEDGITIDAANYKCVYSGRLHENEKMDDLYAVFNDNPHFLFLGQYRVFFLFVLQTLEVLQIQIDPRNMPAYPHHGL